MKNHSRVGNVHRLVTFLNLRGTRHIVKAGYSNRDTQFLALRGAAFARRPLPHHHGERPVGRVSARWVLPSAGFDGADLRSSQACGDHTFERAPDLLLLILGGALRLLAGLAVQVLAAQAGLAAQLGNSGSGQPRFRPARPGPGDHPPRAQAPPSSPPRTPPNELQRLLPS